MLVAIAFLAGCAIGWMRAARRGGSLADRLQYAFAHGVPAALAVIVVYVIGLKAGWFG